MSLWKYVPKYKKKYKEKLNRVSGVTSNVSVFMVSTPWHTVSEPSCKPEAHLSLRNVDTRKECSSTNNQG